MYYILQLDINNLEICISYNEISMWCINISVSLQFLSHLTLLSLLSLATRHLMIPKEHQRTTGWKWHSLSSCLTLRPHGLELTRLLCPWESPGKNTGVGHQSLLQRIFPIQVLKPGLLHCRQIFYCLSHQGSPLYSFWLISALTDPFLTPRGVTGSCVCVPRAACSNQADKKDSYFPKTGNLCPSFWLLLLITKLQTKR